MDFEWVAIALGDVVWITLAFCLGFLARAISLPPLVGFLVAGFILGGFDIAAGEALQKLADLGITLLLFTVGLKLNIKTLARPQVWAVTVTHSILITFIFGLIILGLAQTELPLFSELDLKLSLLIAFALSFSSTVFVVKTLEDKGEMKSLHGSIAIGILVMQDIAAVIFLAVSVGKLPSLWALALFLLIPARPLLQLLLRKSGHGELLVLYGLVLALGGAELFELAGVKDDLGALIIGLLISTHPKSKEMAKALLNLKDLFLVGFFLSIGMSGHLTAEAVVIGLLLLPFMFIKSSLFFILMTRLKLRARTSLLVSLNLSNYSEFGLIVMAIGVSSGWLSGDWLIVMAIAVSASFTISAPLNRNDNRIYNLLRNFWLKFQGEQRLPDDIAVNTKGYTTAIFGMGRIGTGAYDKMRETRGTTLLGVDFNSEHVEKHQQQGRNVFQGDPSDADFWDQVDRDHTIKLIMLALPNLQSNLDAIEQIQNIRFDGEIAAIARYPDDKQKLIQAGVHSVFNVYTESGAGFANHVEQQSQALTR
jgi:predicted Kef-type K+ transport protein